ncbi:nitrous oxide reductase family maturation protein NosD [Bacillus marinisedimentorum]|uniref:nitrous oxide reductase family maturation protein NosD n=1 Tax=Bacillus marinisedimentorum TaxID=1821260 RepID=UPI000872BD41|nr:nitrous oxide reductase family maturation protein NosD [Bacillus marinisedimentorum]
MKKLISAMIVLLAAFGFGTAANAEADLQQLIDETSAGEVLLLDAKEYAGNVIISRPITIKGKKGTVIRGSEAGNVLAVEADGTVLQQLQIKETGFDRNSGEEYAAIKLKSNGNTVKDITITDSFHGVYLSQSHDNKIENVRVTGMKNGEVAGQGNGIHLYYSNANKLIDNEIEGTRDGIFFDYSNDNEVVKNRISHTRYGLHYMYSNDNTFLENIFTYNIGGAAVMHSDRIELRENEFSLNQGTRSFGLLLQSSNRNIVNDNTFFQNQRGLFIDQSTNNRISDNKIFQNQIGIELWSSSRDQVFTKNRFTGNTAEVITLGGDASNKWSDNGEGNYWGNQRLFDLNQDGVGDRPIEYKSAIYQLIEENELAYLFLKSPAIGVFEKMNEIVSKQKVMVVDEHPLIHREGKGLFAWNTAGVLTGALLLFWYRRWKK